MRNSNLAECLEEFEAAMNAMDKPKDKALHVAAVADPELKRRKPRRLSFSSRRILARDTELFHFRVF